MLAGRFTGTEFEAVAGGVASDGDGTSGSSGIAGMSGRPVPAFGDAGGVAAAVPVLSAAVPSAAGCCTGGAIAVASGHCGAEPMPAGGAPVVVGEWWHALGGLILPRCGLAVRRPRGTFVDLHVQDTRRRRPEW